jgi:hypothetical protein
MAAKLWSLPSAGLRHGRSAADRHIFGIVAAKVKHVVKSCRVRACSKKIARSGSTPRSFMSW